MTGFSVQNNLMRDGIQRQTGFVEQAHHPPPTRKTDCAQRLAWQTAMKVEKGERKRKRKYSNRAHLFFTSGLFSFRVIRESLERSAHLARLGSQGGRILSLAWL